MRSNVGSERFAPHDLLLNVGAREDRLRFVEGAWKIARRRMVLDQNVLSAKNLSIFF